MFHARARGALAALLLIAFTAAPALAQQPAEAPDPPPVPAGENGAGRLARFLAGGALGLGLHEAGHVAAAAASGTSVGLKGVSFGPFPFFAITHEPVPAGREYQISSAGFLVQHISTEVLLTKRPGLRLERAPVAKGMLAFNLLASAAYGAAAIARAGPAERDTRGMAAAARIDERWVGVLVLAPAALDTVRYFKPEARWVVWASRGAKVAVALLALRARHADGCQILADGRAPSSSCAGPGPT
ncbi:MAG TPA: hypothetical protein VF198_00185 [Vicinamibacterales bacterium]